MSTITQRLMALGATGAVAASIGLITHFEGREFVPYADTGGVITVCDGHTGGVQNRRYTEAECDALLLRDLYKHDVDISRCLGTTPLKDNERAAFLSFAFNVGAPAFCKSTMARKAASGDVPGACREFARWTMVAGRDCRDPRAGCRGIVKRREAEQRLCEGKA